MKHEKNVSECSAGDSFREFLTNIEVSFQQHAHIDQQMVTWEKERESLSDNAFEEFSRLLFKIQRNDKKTVVTLRRATFDEDKIAAVSEALVSLRETYSEIEEALIRDFSQKYSWFRPSWSIAEILSAAFPPELDPGVVIAEYSRLFFADVEPEELGGNIAVETEGMKFLEVVGEACIDVSKLSPEIKKVCKEALAAIVAPATTSMSDQFSRKFKLLLQTPPHFFLAWAREWWLDFDNDENYAPQLDPEILKLLFRHCGLWSDNSGQRKAVITRSLLLDLLYKACEEDGLPYDVELQHVLRQFFRYVCDVRRRCRFGLSSLGVDVSERLVKDLYFADYDLEIVDFPMYLASGSEPYGPLDVHDIVDSANIQGMDLAERDWMILFDKAIAEGFPELTNALLSVYVLNMAYFSEGALRPSQRLSDTILKGLQMPGSTMLKKSIELIIGWVEGNKGPARQLVQRYLKQFLPEKASLHVLPSRTPKRDEEKTVERFLSEQLGENRWMKLAESSRNFFISAETTWKKCAVEFGFGIKDWSGFVNPFCKAIENELAVALKGVYLSPLFLDDFKKRTGSEFGKPTMGKLVTALLKYESYPEDIRALIDGCCTALPSNKPLLYRLKKLTDMRNQASHKDEFNMTRFSEFKMILFDQRTIHEFIDALP